MRFRDQMMNFFAKRRRPPPEPALWLGLGGAGAAVVTAQIEGVRPEVLLVNTDRKALEGSADIPSLLIGCNLLRGRGAGRAVPHGRRAVQESFTDIWLALRGRERIHIVASAAGGTGGAAPELASLLLDRGCGVALGLMRPFAIEGDRHLADEVVRRARALKQRLLFLEVPDLEWPRNADRRQPFLEALKLLDRALLVHLLEVSRRVDDAR
jgi:cell division protein FtsZ